MRIAVCCAHSSMLGFNDTTYSLDFPTPFPLPLGSPFPGLVESFCYCPLQVQGLNQSLITAVLLLCYSNVPAWC